ncbi:5412_t:CDS:2, partial [Ambispora gerdemannii]
NDQDNRITPSYVAFTRTKRLIDELAKNQVNTNPCNTVYSAKRLLGCSFHETEVQSDIKVEYKDEKMQFAPEEILAMLLGKMKQIAENYLGKKVTNAVISSTAAISLAYGTLKRVTEERNYIDEIHEVKAVAGNNHLGGDDFDNPLRRLRTACEREKIHLSAANHARIELEKFLNGIDLLHL